MEKKNKRRSIFPTESRFAARVEEKEGESGDIKDIENRKSK